MNTSGTADRVAVQASHGAVAAGSDLAAQAALDVLASGGNAVDAAVAASYVQSVVEVPWGGAGGDAFVMVYTPDGDVHVLNGNGASPRDLHTKVSADQQIPRFGALSVTVPGFFAAMEQTHARFGRTPLRLLATPAIDYARQGFALSEHLRGAIERLLPELDQSDPLAQLLASSVADGTGVLRQVRLGDTIERVVTEGSSVFYGELGQGLAHRLRNLGGAMSPEDLAAHNSDWTRPVSATYRGVDVYTHPPVSLGCILLVQLGLYERLGFGYRPPDDPVRLDAMIRCKRRAFAAALPVLLDPEVTIEAADALLDPVALDRLAMGLLDVPVKSLDVIEGGSGDGTDTTCVAAVDEQGCLAVVIHSLFNEFGARVLDPETGLLLNDRLANQRLAQGGRGGVLPGGRPIHTLNAVLAVRDGAPLVMMATPGGRGQVQTSFQVLVNMIDGVEEPQRAIDVPRWLSGAPRKPAPNDQVYVEPSIPAATVDELRRRGHEVVVTDGSSTDLYGSCVAVTGSPGGPLFAAADHRRAAVAGGL